MPWCEVIGRALAAHPAFPANLTNRANSAHPCQGTIATELATLTKLTRFELSSNSLTGVIPTQLGKIKKLMTFDVGINLLTAPLPTQLGAMVRARARAITLPPHS